LEEPEEPKLNPVCVIYLEELDESKLNSIYVLRIQQFGCEKQDI
jgi:hypothetical protein